jgi:hypothetical protein
MPPRMSIGLWRLPVAQVELGLQAAPDGGAGFAVVGPVRRMAVGTGVGATGRSGRLVGAVGVDRRLHGGAGLARRALGAAMTVVRVGLGRVSRAVTRTRFGFFASGALVAPSFSARRSRSVSIGSGDARRWRSGGRFAGRHRPAWPAPWPRLGLGLGRCVFATPAVAQRGGQRQGQAAQGREGRRGRCVMGGSPHRLSAWRSPLEP